MLAYIPFAFPCYIYLHVYRCVCVYQGVFPFTALIPSILQAGGPGSTHTHLGEAEMSLFSEKLHRTTQEKTYINGL